MSASSIEVAGAGRWRTLAGAAALRRAAPRLAGVLGVAGTALVFRPYKGLFGDARIYVGHAVATLDPAGVGRDLLFAYDRQSGLSVFPAMLTGAVARLGPLGAGAAAAAAALAVWTLAALLAVRALVGRREAVPALLCALILPAAYGGCQLGVGEAAPLPRPFAEALVLLSLWALVRDRTWLAVALTAAAAAVHPIMALPGAGVIGVMLCLRDRRWLLVALAVGLAALAGAAAGLPLLDRLTVAMDARWASVLHNRSPYLFLGLWRLEVWSQIVARAVTLGFAAALLDGAARRVAVATLVVTGLALGTSALLGDGVSSVLVLQMQPWRGLWLLSVLSCAAAPVVALRLWSEGATARLAVGLLACGWIAVVLAPLSIAASAASMVVFLAARRGGRLSRPLLIAGWMVTTLAAALTLAGQTSYLLGRILQTPPALRPSISSALLQDAYRVALAAALITAVGLWRARARLARDVPPVIAFPAVLLLVLVGARGWRPLDDGQRLVVSTEAAREVRAITRTRPGAVEWLAGDLEPLMLAGRPAWWTELQGAPSVFSRDLAMVWVARRDRLVAVGVGSPDLLAPFPYKRPARFWTPSPASLRTFCAFPDAPAWIVTALRAGAPAPAGSVLWRPPVDTARTSVEDGIPEPVAVYAFSACGGGA